MQIDSTGFSNVKNQPLKKTPGKTTSGISTNDTFQSSSSKKDPGIIDMKKAAEIVSSQKHEKYNVLWTFKPESKQFIRKEDPGLRETYETIGGKPLQDYLDSIGKPYTVESTVHGDPIFSNDGNILVSTNHGDVFSVSSDGKPTHIKAVPLEQYTHVEKMQQAPNGDLFFSVARDVHSLNPKTGKIQKFESVKGRPGSYFSIGKDGTVYQGTWNKREQNYVYALNPDDTVKWKVPIEKDAIRGAATEGPDGNVHVSTFGGKYLILSPDGKEIARAKLDEEEYTATWQPAISPDGKKSYIGTKQGNVVCLSTKDGKELWKKNLGSDNIEHINIDKDGTVYASRMDGTLVAMDTDGNEKWSRACGGALMTPTTISDDGNLYQVSGDGTLHCFDKKGAGLWKAKMTGQYAPAPIVDKEGTIYVKTESGSLQAIKNTTIKEMVQKAKSKGETKDGVPTIEIGDGYVTIGGVRVKVNK